MTFEGGNNPTGILRVYLDDAVWEFPGIHRMDAAKADAAVIGGTGMLVNGTLFLGKLDAVRIWTAALTGDQIRSNRFAVWPATSGSLVADYPFSEGQGATIHNFAGDHDASAYGQPEWCYGQLIPDDEWSEGSPGTCIFPRATPTTWAGTTIRPSQPGLGVVCLHREHRAPGGLVGQPQPAAGHAGALLPVPGGALHQQLARGSLADRDRQRPGKQ